jgi:two-component system NarL family sensor kinase
MFQENDKIILIIVGIMLLVPFSMVLLFIIFNNRKNKLIQQQELEKKRFETELAESQIEIREETLRNISWEMHDNIGQLVTLAKIHLQNSDYEPTKIEESVEILGNALKELKALSKSINPESLKNMSILEAVHNEIDRFERMNFIHPKFEIKGQPFDIPPKDEIIFFRIIQEFFSNTIRHSRATELKVIFNYSNSELNIQIEDNGIGFETSDDFKGIGLKNMKTRAKLVHSDLKISSEFQKGTKLTIEKNYTHA